MNAETSEALLDVLAKLIDRCNRLEAKLVAAERVMSNRAPEKVLDYLQEIGVVEKAWTHPTAATVLADLRAKMRQDRS